MPQHREDAALDVRAVDPDRAAAELPAVEHEVVGLRAHRERVGLEQVEVVGVGHREGVVGRDRRARRRRCPRTAGTRSPSSNDAARRRPAARAELDAQRTEHRARDARARRRRPGRGRPRARRRSRATTAVSLGARGTWRAGTSSAVGGHAEPRRAPWRPSSFARRSARRAGARQRRRRPGRGSPSRTAPRRPSPRCPRRPRRGRCSSMPNRRSGLSVPKRSRHSAQREPLDRARTLAGRRLRGVEHGLGDEAEDVLLVDEARLDVELGELELAVRAQVLVAHAAGDLVVAVEARRP